MRRHVAVLVTAALLTGAGQFAPAGAAPRVPAGDAAVATVPRPPLDTGTGALIATKAFVSPSGNVKCRRVSSTSGTWLECLLVRSRELVRFGTGTEAVHVPCAAPNRDQTCVMSYGTVRITRATAAQRAAFVGARKVPYERPIRLGAAKAPFPWCVVDPNLGTSCSTGYDDSRGEQLYLGLADSIWSCPGYEDVFDEPVPSGANTCRVIRP